MTQNDDTQKPSSAEENMTESLPAPTAALPSMESENSTDAQDWRTLESAPLTQTPAEEPTTETFSTAPSPSAYSAQPATDVHTASVEEEKPPTRVGQLIWSGIIIIAGVFLFVVAVFSNIDIPTLLISLIALLGVLLIVAALIPSPKRKTSHGK